MRKGTKHSPETIRKISESKKGKNHPMYGRKHSPETKEKMSEAAKGEKNHNYGKEHSSEHRRKISESHKRYAASLSPEEKKERYRSMRGKEHSSESKRKISEAHKGRKHTSESRKNMSEAHKGNKHSSETIRKMSEAHEGKKNHNYGKRFSLETRRRISESIAKAYIEGKMQQGCHKHFHHGFFPSVKNRKDIHHRSGLELAFYQALEDSPIVEGFEPEPISIEYVDSEGNTRRYIPDLVISFLDGTKKLVEIKPKYQLNDPINIAKFTAATEYAKQSGFIGFEVWTEKHLMEV